MATQKAPIWVVYWDPMGESTPIECSSEDEAKKVAAEHFAARIAKYTSYPVELHHAFPQYCGKEPRLKGRLCVAEGGIVENSSHGFLIRKPDAPIPPYVPAGRHVETFFLSSRKDLVGADQVVEIEECGGHPSLHSLLVEGQYCEEGGYGRPWYFVHEIPPKRDGMSEQNSVAHVLLGA